jgi:hypothetical protein
MPLQMVKAAQGQSINLAWPTFPAIHPAAATAWTKVDIFPQMLGGNCLTGVSNITVAAPARM